AFLLCVSSAEAHEAIFAWTYTTDLTPKGHGEFEQWITPRWEKEHGSYSVIDFREECEYGVTDDFQIALYLNHHYVYANDDVPAENPAHPRRRLPGVYETGGGRGRGARSREAVRQLPLPIGFVRIDLSAAQPLQSSDRTRALFRA